tara:strand:- start:773 stop:1279 length:507 start_codon:yes stop_codon:yes gene_type:complete
MSWKDILKETITQGRVKEIEDIDIDIEDDDCLRWLNRLYDILAKEPSAYWYDNNIENEETACKIKENWEDRSGRRFQNRNLETSNTGRVRNRNKKHKISVILQVSHYKKNNTFDVELYSSSNKDKEIIPKEVKWVALEDISEEKAIRKIKELCNYLNISYDKLTEGVF